MGTYTDLFMTLTGRVCLQRAGASRSGSWGNRMSKRQDRAPSGFVDRTDWLRQLRSGNSASADTAAT